MIRAKYIRKQKWVLLMAVNLIISKVTRAGVLKETTWRMSGSEPRRHLGRCMPGRESSPKEVTEAESSLANSLVVSLSNWSEISDRDSWGGGGWGAYEVREVKGEPVSVEDLESHCRREGCARSEVGLHWMALSWQEMGCDCHSNQMLWLLWSFQTGAWVRITWGLVETPMAEPHPTFNGAGTGDLHC